MIDARDRPSDDELVAIVTIVFVLTGAITYALDAPALWLLWAASMVLIAGAALVRTNR